MRSAAFLIFIIPSFWLNICFGQKELTVKQLADSIAKNNYVAPYPDGFLFGETDQYKFWVRFTEKASTEELVAYTDDPRPIVRVHAIKGLNERHYEKLFSIALRHLHDTAMVSEPGMHRSSQRFVGDYFFVTQNMSENESRQLDSVLFFTDNRLRRINHILDDLPVEEKYYKRLRELAATKDFAVEALAKYKKEEDIEFIASRILNNSYFTLEAIENFPAEEFKKVLITLRERGFNYYGTELAVAVFRDEFSVDYFNQSLNNYNGNDYGKKERARYIFEAIEQYHHPIYDQLYFRIWEEYNKIDEPTFEYLKTVNPVCVLELTKMTLGKFKDFEFNSTLIAPLLNFLAENDSVAAKQLIIFHINRGHYDNLSPFTEKAIEYNDPEIVNALFNQLKKAQNPYVYIPVIECLLRYNNPAYHEQLLVTVRENAEIKDWGLEKVDKLLAEYGLKR